MFSLSMYAAPVDAAQALRQEVHVPQEQPPTADLQQSVALPEIVEVSGGRRAALALDLRQRRAAAIGEREARHRLLRAERTRVAARAERAAVAAYRDDQGDRRSPRVRPKRVQGLQLQPADHDDVDKQAGSQRGSQQQRDGERVPANDAQVTEDRRSRY